MALFFADLVREASWGMGTSDLPLGGALPGHRRFADAVPPGARFHYCIAGVTHPDEWETGEGEIGSADTLIRLPFASSAGGAVVPFSPGLKTVALTVNADWFARSEDDGPIDPEALAAKADLAGAAFTGPVSAPALSLDVPLGPANGGTGASNAGDARTNLGLVIGTDVQAQNARLADIAANLSAASGAVEKTRASTFGTFTVSSYGKSLIDDADAAAARTTLGLGSLATLSSVNDGNWSGADLSIANGGTGASSASGARTNLGLGTAATQNTGTSGANVPLLNGANIWSAKQIVDGVDAAAAGGASTGAINIRNTLGASLSLDIGIDSNVDYGFIQARNFAGSDYRTLALNPAGGVVTYGGIELGYRDIPRVTGGLERGKCFAASSGVTIGTGPAAGSTYSIYNDSGSAITLTQGSGLTLRLGGTGTTGSRTLAARGFATIWYNSATEAIASGAGVS